MALSAAKVKVSALSARSQPDGHATVNIVVEVKDKEELSGGHQQAEQHSGRLPRGPRLREMRKKRGGREQGQLGAEPEGERRAAGRPGDQPESQRKRPGRERAAA